MDRFHLAQCGVHTQSGSNRRTTQQFGLRNSRVRKRSQRRFASWHAGNGACFINSGLYNSEFFWYVAVNSTTANMLVVSGKHLRKTFAREREAATVALDELSIEVRRGTLTALVGPDGAGKTTLIRLIAALMRADAGELTVLDLDAATQTQQIQDRIGYMPQRFGLYEDLTVQENLDLYADLHGIPLQERQQRYPQLMSMTALEPFKKRLAGKLSGGMKQKLGLACTLVRSPELLLLDEPTVGVDPLSRRELWEIIHHLVDEQQLTVLMSTAYLDEAERCHEVLVLHQGKVLAHGPPQQVADHAQGRTFVIEPP